MEVFVSSTYWYKCSTLYGSQSSAGITSPEQSRDESGWSLPYSPEMEDGHRLTQSALPPFAPPWGCHVVFQLSSFPHRPPSSRDCGTIGGFDRWPIVNSPRHDN
jgi:hypothetical protein